jgi:hypothetical protein
VVNRIDGTTPGKSRPIKYSDLVSIDDFSSDPEEAGETRVIKDKDALPDRVDEVGDDGVKTAGKEDHSASAPLEKGEEKSATSSHGESVEQGPVKVSGQFSTLLLPPPPGDEIKATSASSLKGNVEQEHE